MSNAATKAVYHTYNRILTRKVLQIVLEVPLEQEAAVHASIGYPSPDGSTWVGIARLQEPSQAQADKPKRSWDQLSRAEQAGIACESEEFQRFLRETYAMVPDGDPAFIVRDVCHVKSRSEFDSIPQAGRNWDGLYSNYQLWKRGAKAA